MEGDWFHQEVETGADEVQGDEAVVPHQHVDPLIVVDSLLRSESHVDPVIAARFDNADIFDHCKHVRGVVDYFVDGVRLGVVVEGDHAVGAGP